MKTSISFIFLCIVLIMIGYSIKKIRKDNFVLKVQVIEIQARLDKLDYEVGYLHNFILDKQGKIKNVLIEKGKK